MKENVTKLQSASSVDEMMTRQTCAVVCRESTEARSPSRYCDRKEEYDPMQLYTPTIP